MSITPSPYQPQIGTRYQFTWDHTVPEVGYYTIASYPGPPTLSGPGVAVLGKGYNSLLDTVVVSTTTSFTLYRESDNQTQTITFTPATYTITDILNAINGAFPAPNFAYPSFVAGSDEQAIFLIDKKPLVGNAGIEVRLDLTDEGNRNRANQITGLFWGQRSTTNTAATTFQVMEKFGGVLPRAEMSSAFTIPAGADTVSLLLRASMQPGVTLFLAFLWSDGQSPFNGSTGSLQFNSLTGLGPAKQVGDYGFAELSIGPTQNNYGFYPLLPAGTFSFADDTTEGYNVDPGYPAQPISDYWKSHVLDLRPPPGATQLRLWVVTADVDTIAHPNGFGFLPRVQAYAWGSRRGAI